MDRILNHAPAGGMLVLAHRGMWGNQGGVQVPENSLSGMHWANEKCVDGVEFDIKLTSDGVPMLMHDFNLGRTTNVWTIFRGGSKYDPISNRGTNPTVASVSYQALRNLRLLSPDRSRVMEAVKLPSVNDLFDAVTQYGYTIPMVFDVKDDAAVSAIAQRSRLAFGPNSPYYVAVKVNATLYPDPAQFTYGNITAIPVYTTNMLAKINVQQSLDKWIRQYGAKTVEINVKQSNGLLAREKRIAETYGAKIAVFQAIPDGPRANEFYQNTGACCYKLSDIYATYNGKSDTDDRRGSMNFIKAAGFGLVTTDKP
ncbi:hypothetical protein XarbCFBP8152_09975 [Xanthomonas arboricola]|nr:hypothetical protein XarbCFBP8152_09975 [Xanthomonas arboricola]